MDSERESYCRGTDVSHWQGDINWQLVRDDGIKFAYIKATEGADYTDPKFFYNIKGAKEAGILAGAYHFCTPSSMEDAVNEARHFISTIKKSGGLSLLDLPPVIDIEKNPGLSKKQMSEIVSSWVGTVWRESGIQPVIYSYTYFIWNNLDESLCDIPLWLAHYDSRKIPDCSPWKTWLFLQYTDKGQVRGISGSVDLNQFNGNLADLRLFCRRRSL